MKDYDLLTASQCIMYENASEFRCIDIDNDIWQQKINNSWQNADSDLVKNTMINKVYDNMDAFKQKLSGSEYKKKFYTELNHWFYHNGYSR